MKLTETWTMDDSFGWKRVPEWIKAVWLLDRVRIEAKIVDGFPFHPVNVPTIMQATLMPLDGADPIRLHKDVTVVGRKRGVCDLLVDRTSVSKLHCLIVKTDGLLFIRDLGSTNGTKVNGQRVTRGALLPGDELAFANAQYRVDLRPDAPADRDEESADGATEMMSSRPDNSDAAAAFQDADSESDVRLLSDSDSEI